MSLTDEELLKVYEKSNEYQITLNFFGSEKSIDLQDFIKMIGLVLKNEKEIDQCQFCECNETFRVYYPDKPNECSQCNKLFGKLEKEEEKPFVISEY